MRRKAVLVVSTLCALLTFLGLGIFGAGRFLVVNQEPVPSDAIIVLGGEIHPRIEKGVELYNQHLAPKLVLSGGNLFTFNMSEAERMALYAEQNGVPSNHIITESKSTSTYENALFTKDILTSRGMKSAIVVSSSYHMRRVQYTFNTVYRGSGIRLTYVAALEPDWRFNPNVWWSTDDSKRTTISEYVKLTITAFVFLLHIPNKNILNQ